MKNKIIACVDESKSAESVVDWAAWIATRMEVGVTLLHLIERSHESAVRDHSGVIGLGTSEALLSQLTQLDEERGKVALEHGKIILQAASVRLESFGIKDRELVQRHANLVETLAEMDSEMGLLVIGKQGGHSENSLAQIGSHLENVIRAIHRPILVAVSEFKAPERILIAYDGSENSQKILAFVLSHPKLFQQASIHLLSVGDQTLPQLETAKNKLIASGFMAESFQENGEFEAIASRFVKEHAIDLLLMGAYGHSAIRRFVLGSHTTRMLHLTQVSLLLIR